MINRHVWNVLIAWLVLMGSASAQNFWGLTTNQTLVRFLSSAPGNLAASLPITGLPDGERIIGIEVLTPEAAFVGVSSAGRFYALDRLTGAATILNPAAPVVPITGTAFGLRDRGGNLEVVSNDGSRWNGSKGGWGVARESRLVRLLMWSPGRRALTGCSPRCWTRAPTPCTGLGFGPGSLIGPLNVDTSDEAGLDSEPHTGKLYAALTVTARRGCTCSTRRPATPR